MTKSLKGWPPNWQEKAESLRERNPREQAWEYVHTAERGDDSVLEVLRQLDDKAKGELAGLSAFGESGNQPELLSQSVDPFLLTNRPRTWDSQHVRSALLRLGFPGRAKPRGRRGTEG